MFDSKPKYLITISISTLFIAEAIIGQRVIKFACRERQPGSWEMEFKEFSPKKPRGTVKLSGSGNEITVFSMMLAVLGEFIERYKPAEIEFTADTYCEKSSRGKLYDRIFRKFTFDGYVYSRFQGKIQDTFWLTRID